MNRDKLDTFFIGFILMVIGGLFLMDNFGWLDFNLWSLLAKFWPLILVYIGLKNIIVYFAEKK